MTGLPVAIIPIRSLDGKSRLSASLDPTVRIGIIRDLASRVVAASVEASMHVIVVSADTGVASLVRDLGATVAADPGTGLDDAARIGVDAAAGEPWLVLHADLPLVTAAAVASVVDRVCVGRTVLVPSLDGGTNAVASTGPFSFSFGPGSFHRHLAHRPDADVVVDARLGIDLDTPAHLGALGLPVP
jgi:2-phospho-L-lactate guanylyltransferase